MDKTYFKALAILLFITVFIFLPTGCAPEEEVVINYVTEKTGSDDQDTTGQDATETVQEANIPEDEEIEGSQEPEKEDDTLTFESSFIGGNKGLLIINIDLGSGEVTGTLEMDSVETYLEGTNTKICNFKITGVIEGIIDPETGAIKGTMDGEARSDVPTCIGGQVRYDTEAQLFENRKFITGEFITSTLKYGFVMERK